MEVSHADDDNDEETGQVRPEQETGEPRSVDSSRRNFYFPQNLNFTRNVFSHL